jgi:hypothetical protein
MTKRRSVVCKQGNERELIMDEVNSYQRAIQHQQLEKDQFGAADPPGFLTQVCMSIMSLKSHACLP